MWIHQFNPTGTTSVPFVTSPFMAPFCARISLAKPYTGWYGAAERRRLLSTGRECRNHVRFRFLCRSVGGCTCQEGVDQPVPGQTSFWSVHDTFRSGWSCICVWHFRCSIPGFWPGLRDEESTSRMSDRKHVQIALVVQWSCFNCTTLMP